MRPRTTARLGVALTVAVMLAAGGAQAVAYGSVAVAVTPTLTATASPAAIVFGQSATIAGVLNSPDGPLADRAVRVFTSPSPDGPWTDAPPATYDAASQDYKAPVSPTANTYFKMVFAGDADYTAAESAPVQVSVAAWLGLPSTPARVAKNAKFQTKGVLKPGVAGAAKLYFYRSHRGKWRLFTVRTVRATPAGGQSKYSLASRVPYTGSWRVKTVYADQSHATASSLPRRFSVRGASSPVPIGLKCAKGCH